jgi:hypothetical protein
MAFHIFVHKDETYCTTRENLKNAHAWLFDWQKKKAKEIAETGTDEDCDKLLKELQDSSERELAYWRFTQ